MHEHAYTANSYIALPNNKITEDKPEYIYVPLRGLCSCLAVFDLEDKCIGWIDTRTLGYENAQEYMTKTNWKDNGY